MSIVQESKGDIRILRLDGRLDAVATAALFDILEGLIKIGEYRIVLDMTELGTISSYGLGVLVMSNRHLKEKGGGLRLAGLSQDVKVPFEITGTLPQFQVFDDLEKALAGF